MSDFVTEDMIELIKAHEGFSSTPYRDTVGILTVGYGRNLEDVGISQEEAERLLRNDVYGLEQSIIRIIPDYYNLSDNRKSVIVNMAFNLGIPRFRQFIKTIDFVNRGLFTEASIEMLNSRWATQVKGRAKYLSDMMRKG
jgi:lysozyme